MNDERLCSNATMLDVLSIDKYNFILKHHYPDRFFTCDSLVNQQADKKQIMYLIYRIGDGRHRNAEALSRHGN